VKALKEATDAMDKIAKHTESDAAVKAFTDAREDIEKCFKQYGVRLISSSCFSHYRIDWFLMPF